MTQPGKVDLRSLYVEQLNRTAEARRLRERAERLVAWLILVVAPLAAILGFLLGKYVGAGSGGSP